MTPLTLILLIGGGLILLLVVTGLIVTVTSEQSLVDERLRKYVEERNVVQVGKEDRQSPVGDWINVRLEKSTWGGRLSRELARADIKLKPGEYIAVVVMIAILGAVIGWLFGGQSEIIAIIGAIVGSALPRFYVKRNQNQRLSNFNNQLADMLNLMVNGLRAGYSTMQSMESVSREMPQPISVEFHRVVQEMQIGIAMEQALENLLRRIPSDDLDLIIAALNVQREVGGNLAEILDIISHTIRERVRIKGEIRVLTSQVMYSGRFLAMMPLIITLVLYLVNRPYMMQFFNPETRLVGIPILIIGALMIIAGYYVMTRIAKIEI